MFAQESRIGQREAKLVETMAKELVNCRVKTAHVVLVYRRQCFCIQPDCVGDGQCGDVTSINWIAMTPCLVDMPKAESQSFTDLWLVAVFAEQPEIRFGGAAPITQPFVFTGL